MQFGIQKNSPVLSFGMQFQVCACSKRILYPWLGTKGTCRHVDLHETMNVFLICSYSCDLLLADLPKEPSKLRRVTLIYISGLNSECIS